MKIKSVHQIDIVECPICFTIIYKGTLFQHVSLCTG